MFFSSGEASKHTSPSFAVAYGISLCLPLSSSSLLSSPVAHCEVAGSAHSQPRRQSLSAIDDIPAGDNAGRRCFDFGFPGRYGFLARQTDGYPVS